MDFSRLTPSEINDFLLFHNRIPVPGFMNSVQQAQDLFEVLRQNPESKYTEPVIDLFLATQFLQAGKAIPQKYTEAQILNLSPELKQIFAEVVNLSLDDPNFNTRLIRILRMIGAIQSMFPIIATEPICSLTSFENQTSSLDWEMPEPPEPEDPDSTYSRLTCLGAGDCFFHAFLRAVNEAYIQSYEIPETITEERIQFYENTANINLTFSRGTLKPNRPAKKNRRPEKVYEVVDENKFAKTMNRFRTKYACTFRERLARYLSTNEDAQNLILERFPEAFVIFLDEISVQMEESGLELTDEEIQDRARNNTIQYFARRVGSSGTSIEPDILILLSELYNFDIYILGQSKISQPESGHPFPDSDLTSVIRGPLDMRLEGDPYFDAEERTSIVLIHLGGIEGHYDLVVREDPDGDIITQFDSSEPLIRRLYEYVRSFDRAG